MPENATENEIKTLDDLKDKVNKFGISGKGYVVSIYTDKVRVGKYAGQNNSPFFGYDQTDNNGAYDESIECLLEMRVFDEKKEIKIFRPTIADPFVIREINDALKEKDFFDELQYLDIDTKRSKDCPQNADGRWVRATGGGMYFLPLTEDVNNATDLEYAVLKIRYYIDKYPDSGKAFISDWRCVGFYKSKDDTGCECSWEGGEKNAD